jgi:hypothetical protein
MSRPNFHFGSLFCFDGFMGIKGVGYIRVSKDKQARITECRRGTAKKVRAIATVHDAI